MIRWNSTKWGQKNTNMHEYNLLHNAVCLLIRSSHLIFVINNTFALPLPNTHYDACTIHCSWQSLIPTDIGIQCHRKPSLELSQSSKGSMCTKCMHTLRHNLFTYHCCLQTTNSLNTGLHPNTYFYAHTYCTLQMADKYSSNREPISIHCHCISMFMPIKIMM